ncbi:hypothetical protein [Bowmanella yangjiangensis]|uniref:Uncharacterized protein n=1 Tax=Bowmanella yangjiangensis TaxID=2811230 RepID=A0ABS3CS24_9ALTE|nr:hypothetical protein [Bowmanella yangjiangensis]MBN7819435.1 hypothetical protein [Bowmanella yangjiangensis]
MTKLRECMGNGLYCDSVNPVRSSKCAGVIAGVDVFNGNLGGINRRGLDAEFVYDIGSTAIGDFQSMLNWSYVGLHDGLAGWAQQLQ